MDWTFWKKWFTPARVASAPRTLPADLQTLFNSPIVEGLRIRGTWQGRTAALEGFASEDDSGLVLRLACQADLWCRRIQSVTTMLDPTLFESYTTGDERIDEDWIVQSNPPFAFRKNQKEGCDALLALMQLDSGLHAAHGWLMLRLSAIPMGTRPEIENYFRQMLQVVVTAEREMKALPG